MTDKSQEKRALAERHFEAGAAKEAAGDTEGAIAAYSLAIQADIEWTKPLIARGSLRHKLGRMAEAIDDFTRAIRLEPSHAQAYAKRGVCYLTERDYAGADNDFSKALEAAPTHAVLLAKRSETRLALGKPWEALADANAIVDNHPEAGEGYYRRGLALEKLDDEQGAEVNFRKAAQREHHEARAVLRKRYGG